MGYRQAYAQNGLPLELQWTWLEGAADLSSVIGHWLKAGVTAIVAETGSYLYRLVQTCHDLGVMLPQDLSLAFLGDLAVDLPWELDATTFAIPREHMGATAVRLLAELLAQDDVSAVRQVTLPCRLSIR